MYRTEVDSVLLGVDILVHGLYQVVIVIGVINVVNIGLFTFSHVDLFGLLYARFQISGLCGRYLMCVGD